MKTQGCKSKTIYSFFKATSTNGDTSNTTSTAGEDSISNAEISNRDESDDQHQHVAKHPRLSIDVSVYVQLDPAMRIPIWKCPVNERDAIRRAYILRKAYQPVMDFPRTWTIDQNRRFKKDWYEKFPWIEYSPHKDAAFCFPCFLFQEKQPLHPTYTIDGFRNWRRVNDNHKCAFLIHVGSPTSPHNNAVQSMGLLMNSSGHIDKVMNAQTSEEVKKNRLRLTATIESIRWLCLQGCALRGHDESPSSKNQGNLIEMVKLMGNMNADIKHVVLENAPRNAKYTSPDIQQDILHIFAERVRKKIREEIGNSKFCLLVDEAKDISDKEQMATVLRFVDREGFSRENFFDIVHVSNTTALTLKEEISNVLGCYNLHIKDIRGQGYDGASNMRGSWNGLQALFLRDSPQAYYIHCFAHRLQLALVGAAEKQSSIWLFFSKLTSIVNIMKASPKRHNELKTAQAIEIANMVAGGICETGTGLNQVGSLQRAGKTRWSSHFESICGMIDMYRSVITVFEHIVDEASSNSIRGEATGSLIAMRSFDFIFILSLLHKIMGVTDLLCKALQEKSLDILNAMGFVGSTKTLLRTLKDEGFDVLLTYVQSVCEKNGVEIPDMKASYGPRRSCQQKDSITVEHHYHFDVFNEVINFQIEELESRFNDGSVELLLLELSSALEPRNNFKLFDGDKIYNLAAKFYPGDFSRQDLHYLRSQLEHYKCDIIRHERFQNMSTISELCRRLVETEKTQHYHLIDRLIRLVLTLPVSTATTERSFSAMKLLKTPLRNKMEEEYLADALIVYIEREFTKGIEINSVTHEFYSMKNRRAQLL